MSDRPNHAEERELDIDRVLVAIQFAPHGRRQDAKAAMRRLFPTRLSVAREEEDGC